MAWVAEENFDSYSTGDLDGGAGGSGWSSAWAAQNANEMLVSTGQYLNSPNSLNTSDSGGAGDYRRPLTTSFATGTLYFAFYVTAGAAEFVLNLRAGGLATMGITLAANGDIKVLARTPSIAWYTVGTFSDDTMYIMEMDIDTTSDQYRVRWKEEGGEYGAYSSYYTPRNTSSITQITLNSNPTSFAVYIDAISATDPDASASTSIKSRNGLAIASVKSINGLAIASIKSVNGISNVS